MATSSSDYRVAVIGAGVVGLAAACRLANARANVVLIDPMEPGLGCSYGNAGHIATELIFPLASPATLAHAPRYLLNSDSPLSVRGGYALQILPWLTRFALASRPSAFKRGTEALAELQAGALESLRNLLRTLGLEQQLQTRGHIVLAETRASQAALLNEQESLAEYDVPTTWLSAAEVAELAPDLTTNLQGALHFPGSGHVLEPYQLSQGFFAAFQEAGGQYLRGGVRKIATRSDGSFELQVEAKPITSEKIVLAAGAWSKSLARDLGHRLPLDTERGYHLSAPGWSGSFNVPIASYERKTIMTPLSSGLRITGFVEFGGLDLPPAASRFGKLETHIRALLPNAEFPEFKRWMGFRPSMPDHLPVIGASPKNPNAILAFGHQHLGLTLAGITADIVECLVANRRPPINIQPFRCDRF
ncbi:MAG TPA: FAD-binding oxidoreductase [Woeseiaceae bacterium]|nr:FAD-binding oxidoreductase [Woeseiaceae bacterium]